LTKFDTRVEPHPFDAGDLMSIIKINWQFSTISSYIYFRNGVKEPENLSCVEHSPEIKEFIHDHSDLFWSLPEDKKVEISEAVLVEYILNYGTLQDCLRLMEIMGVRQVAAVFRKAEGRQKLNYFPEIYNFFSLYFARHA